MKYIVQKRPIAVVAMQLNNDTDWGEVAQWCGGHLTNDCSPDMSNCPLSKSSHVRGIHIPTREGWTLATYDFWVIQGVLGEFHPVDPAVFAITYDFVWTTYTQ